ncbi:enoyl-CoA hydratase-related protein [Amycolatopsis rhabdoformis]|uniref:Enoyl-CoA hydratase-related protein n=1 Tax=Amycolatopsis rhabdoformis TaxID=1448059 RepID=A0ABZ1IEQ1_9PSEU|nr:enoyl-CoA hydratase-related protein [Amycolatopsis rhabdoformis]WSE32571.1 enoyl-CoA hydratase-related protein [Amycolatopsis rhabdoformis]
MKTSEFENVGYEVRDHVAVVTLNRPDRRNAWDGAMAVEYRWALHHADTDPQVGVVLLTGAGDMFCVGADAGTLSDVDRTGGYVRARAELPPYPADAPAGMRHNHTYPLALSVPVIAAINGPCAGAGFVLACFADIRLAADNTKITPSFAGLGLPAEYGIGWILPRICGTQNAAEILMTNAVMTTAEAKELGFVRRSYPRETFPECAFEYARGIARHSSPASLAAIKRQLYVDAEADLDQAYLSSVSAMNAMVAGPDFRTGLRAMRAKQRPWFLGDPAAEA